MKRFMMVAALVVCAVLALAATAYGAPEPPYDTNAKCLQCHDVAGSGAFSKVDFDVPGIPGTVDYARCAACHNYPPDVSFKDHMHWSYSCANCHAEDDAPYFNLDPITMPDQRTKTAFGWFRMQPTQVPSQTLHALHTGANWVNSTFGETHPQCAKCHATATCNACHTQAVEHGQHGSTEYPAPVVKQATGSMLFTAQVQCVNAACHSLAKAGTAAFDKPACLGCHTTYDEPHGYDNVDHVADDAMVHGTACSSCHDLDLETEHLKHTDKLAACTTCHPSPRDTFGAWDQSCVTGGCHSMDSTAPFHAEADAAHVVTRPGNTMCFDCHAGTDLASAHADAVDAEGRTSCLVCHNASTPVISNDCATCHFEWEQHPASGHEAPNSASCGGAFCHDIDNAANNHQDCATCHMNPTRVPVLPETSDCSHCHVSTGPVPHFEVHGADPALMVNNKPRYAFYTGSAPGGPFTSACAGCHTSNLVDEHMGSMATQPRKDRFGTPLNCSSCHNSSNSRVVLAIAGGRTNCDACHTNPMTGGEGVHGPINPTHRSAFKTSPEVPCAPCHSSNLVDEHNGTRSWPDANGVQLSYCDVCHENYAGDRGQQVQTAIEDTKDTKCTACHSSEHRDLGGHTASSPASLACGTCHAEGMNQIDVRAVHSGSSLGACAVCHSNPARIADITAKTAECASCHAAEGNDYHRGLPQKHTYTTMDPSCLTAGCHVAKTLPEEHERFIGQYGYSSTCAMCHRNSDPNRIPATATAACDSCHDVHGDMDEMHTAPMSQECVGCHKSADLRVVHKACGTCHNNTVNTNVTADCVNCHAYSPVEEYHYPAQAHLAVETGCDNCHYLDMDDEHTRAHINVSCVQCHTTKVETMTRPWDKRCASCHPVKHGNMAAKHVSNNTSCGSSQCHNIGNVADIHKGLPAGGCSACHISPDDPATTTNCSAAGCHQNVDGNHREAHDGRMANGEGCEGCHFRYLDDEHAKLGMNCATCHRSTDTVVRNAIKAGDRRCLTCHPYSAHNARQAAEFNAGNASLHRVTSNLPGMRSSFNVNGTTYTMGIPAASTFLRPGWNTNSLTPCNTCHSYSGAQGPHGATVKVNIDPMYPNPYRVVDGRETFTAQLSANSPTGMSMTKNGSQPAGIICEKCHVLRTSSGTWSNVAHKEHDDRGREGAFCNQCHVAIPHGWGRPRLIGYVSDPAPYRTWVGTTAAKDGGITRISLKNYTPTSWQKADCGAGCDTGKHPLNGTSWPNVMGSAPSATTGTVAGKVTDASNGMPVMGAAIALGGKVAASGSDGTYAFPNVEQGSYVITASLAGYQTWSGPVTVTAGKISTVNIMLTPVTGGGQVMNLALNGTATASSTDGSNSPSRAIDGSSSTYWRSSSGGTQWLRVDLGATRSINKVVIDWDGSRYARAYSVQTSMDGVNWTTRFSTSSATSGTKTHDFTTFEARYVRLHCTQHNDSHYRVREFEIWGTNAAPAPITTGSVSGLVRDSLSTAAVADASLTLNGQSTVSNVNGTYAFSDVPQGSYTLTVSKPGYNTWSGPVTVEAGKVTTANVSLVLMPVAPVATNFALSGTATASSTDGSNSPSRAIDGSSSTFWRSSSGGTQWLRVDLGTTRSISKVVVDWESSRYARAYSIQTSADGVNWTTRFSTTSGQSGTRTHTFAAVDARFVRLHCTQHNDSHYRVREFEIWNF